MGMLVIKLADKNIYRLHPLFVMVSIRWLGHSCFRIRNEEGISLIIDPHDGHSLGLKPPDEKGEIILITHDHFDHNQYRNVEREGSQIIRDAGVYSYGGYEIRGFDAFHDDSGGKKRGNVVVFSICTDGMKMSHLGDLGHQPGTVLRDALAGTDILFLPVGGYYTIDAQGAWSVIDAIKPRVVVPMHYGVGGLSLRLDPLDRFLSVRDTEKTSVGNEIDLLREDLPERTEVWIFSL